MVHSQYLGTKLYRFGWGGSGCQEGLILLGELGRGVVGEEERFLCFLYSWKSCSLSLFPFGEAKKWGWSGVRGPALALETPNPLLGWRDT